MLSLILPPLLSTVPLEEEDERNPKTGVLIKVLACQFGEGFSSRYLVDHEPVNICMIRLSMRVSTADRSELVEVSAGFEVPKDSAFPLGACRWKYYSMNKVDCTSSFQQHFLEKFGFPLRFQGNTDFRLDWSDMGASESFQRKTSVFLTKLF